MSRIRRAAVLAVLAACTVHADDRRPITETDLFRMVWVADPRISPDGKRVAFVRVSVNKQKDAYETAVWMVATDGSEPARAFTGGSGDTSPRWSPDGRWLAFTRAVEKDGRPQPAQLYVMSTNGGEARALTHLPKAAADPAWSPDGKRIAFTSTTADKDLAEKKARSAEADKAQGEERESDVRVITRAVYRSNASGYLDPSRPSHLWTVAAATEGPPPDPVRVTTGEFSEGEPVWSLDGARLYFVSTRVKEPYYEPPHSELYSVPAGGGEPRMEVEIDGTIAGFALSPDGSRVAFRGTLNGHPARSYNQPDLFVADLEGGGARNLTASYDYDVGGSLTGDQRAPRGSHPADPAWSRSGRSVVVRTAEKGRANLVRVDAASGKVEPVTAGDQEVMSYTATPDGRRLALVLSTATMVGDLFALDETSPPRRLTRFNDELFAGLDLTPPEELAYASFDGRRIQAWVQKPPDFQAGRSYPLILNIHGGPHAAYGYTFDHEFQWMAAKGYVVLYPNPRGSSSYGQEFGNLIQYRYPGDDYEDLMAGVDELVRRGLVDPKRLGVTGGSGGGVLTNWTITHTDRFAAAVSQRSIADWIGFWYTADFTLFRPNWFRGAPWEQRPDFAERSPITHVTRVTTPLMLIEGEADHRTPPGEGGEQMFRALKYLKKPVVMVRFPEESHELSRSGKPWHRVERLQHILAWFDKYLLDRPVEGYDLP